MPSSEKQSSELSGRAAGVVLHPTSLPGKAAMGTLGPEAYHFVDFLKNCGFKYWQVLPLVPTHEDLSPYMGLSVYAGNPTLISIETLQHWGWIPDGEYDSRQQAITKALGQMRTGEQGDEINKAFTAFRKQHQDWLPDYALFVVIRDQQDKRHWSQWPTELRDRKPSALDNVKSQLSAELEFIEFEQFVFFEQWRRLKTYALERGVYFFGDIPIFVAYDSAEVWAHRKYFALDEQGAPEVVAGVPPDYFSENGQLWGNPLYDWKHAKDDDFAWWLRRFSHNLEMFDLVRIDHFRGFQACWEVPAGEQTAINGKWVKVPGAALFRYLQKNLGHLPVVAEDLGTITPEVEALRDRFGFPGMKILQFAFDGNPGNPYLPHYHIPNSVVYTGTHDNDTSLGWYQTLDGRTRGSVRDYIGTDVEAMPWALVRLALMSVARLAMLPLQDILALDSSHRMNTPGTDKGNWSWRFDWTQVKPDLPSRINTLLRQYHR